jgi:hypothetical protein
MQEEALLPLPLPVGPAQGSQGAGGRGQEGTRGRGRGGGEEGALGFSPSYVCCDPARRRNTRGGQHRSRRR